MKVMSLLSCLLLYLYSCSSFATAIQDKHIKIEHTIVNAMKTFNVPGVAVAIVKNDQVVFNQGFGFIERGKPKKVTSNTLFGIASNTKAMTVALLAQLVDQYKISWHTRIVDILPEFQLYNASVTQEFTLTDLLSHRSGLGLGAGDLILWPKRSYTEADLFNGLKHLPQVSGFRTEFTYSNLMYVIAGKVIEKITEKSWHQNIQTQLFTPLGMNNTFANSSQFNVHLSKLKQETKQGIAIPHIFSNKKLVTLETSYLESFASAGSVISSAKDMALWIKGLLNSGKVSEVSRLYSQTQANKMWQPQTLREVSDIQTKHDKTHFSAYGLGWFLNDFHGVKLIHHSGSMPGMVSKVALIPEENIGVVILTNQQSHSALDAIYRDIFEVYFGLPETDWVSYYAKKEKQQLSREESKLSRIGNKLTESSSPLLKLNKYAQTYIDKWYGEIIISLKADKLVVQFGRTPILKGELIHYEENTFIVRWEDRTLKADAYVKFKTNAEGDVSLVTMKAISSLTDFSFDFQDLELRPKTKIQQIRLK